MSRLQVMIRFLRLIIIKTINASGLVHIVRSVRHTFISFPTLRNCPPSMIVRFWLSISFSLLVIALRIHYYHYECGVYDYLLIGEALFREQTINENSPYFSSYAVTIWISSLMCLTARRTASSRVLLSRHFSQMVNYSALICQTTKSTKRHTQPPSRLLWSNWFKLRFDFDAFNWTITEN